MQKIHSPVVADGRTKVLKVLKTVGYECVSMSNWISRADGGTKALKTAGVRVCKYVQPD